MHVIAQTEQCIASGECVLACSKVFAQDEDGIVQILDADPPASLHEPVRDAVAACPAGVLEIDAEPSEA
jgi:ferredoxin